MAYKPHGKDPYRDKHEKGYNEPYTQGESQEWLDKHLDDQAKKQDPPPRVPRSD